MIYKNILCTIGNTPLVRLNKLNKNKNTVLAVKLESFNPGGSIKDRIAQGMLESAVSKGKLKKGWTVIEATGAGNTGVGLAIACRVMGFNCILVMPDKVSGEKRDLLKAYGAKVVITPTAVPHDDRRSYYEVTKRLLKDTPNSFGPAQYDNKDNPKAHYLTTGREIWDQTNGKITHLVSGMGTGGTITGAGRYLKKKNSQIKIIGVDHIGSVYLEYFKTGKLLQGTKTYLSEGIGEDMLPEVIEMTIIDQVMQVGDKECFHTARKLALSEGILAGGSSGAAVYCALKVALSLKKGLVVAILPDTGANYLSKIYSDEWMKEKGFIK